MNGVHDVGGRHGFGRVRRGESEPVFHAEWGKAVVAISRMAGALGITNIDESRYGIEQMDPAKYLTSSYYERWLDRSIRNLIAKGVIEPGELEDRVARIESDPSLPLPEPPRSGESTSLVSQVRAGRSYKR